MSSAAVPESSSFRIVTHNVLATANLSRGNYQTPPDLLRKQRRVPALMAHVKALGADIICLQEVEPDVFDDFELRLGRTGYQGWYELKVGGRPDGCAVFFRRSRFALASATRLDFHDRDAGPDRHSGHVAQLLSLEMDGKKLLVANTRIRWDRGGIPRDQLIGLPQAVELLAKCRAAVPPADGPIVCGDFNCGEKSAVFAEMTAAGFTPAHDGRTGVRSSVFNGNAKLIDYVFHTAPLVARPINPPAIADDSVLPSADQPSDHLALAADMDWR